MIRLFQNLHMGTLNSFKKFTLLWPCASLWLTGLATFTASAGHDRLPKSCPNNKRWEKKIPHSLSHLLHVRNIYHISYGFDGVFRCPICFHDISWLFHDTSVKNERQKAQFRRSLPFARMSSGYARPRPSVLLSTWILCLRSLDHWT